MRFGRYKVVKNLRRLQRVRNLLRMSLPDGSLLLLKITLIMVDSSKALVNRIVTKVENHPLSVRL